MSQHTYLKIGGPARLYLVATSSEEILAAVEKATELNIPWYVFGGGSNLLVSDQGFQGVVIQALNRSYTIEGINVTAESGVFMGLLAKATADVGLTWFEWGVGVPGTVGGATYGNAGCFSGEMKDVVSSVEAYDVTRGSRVTYTNTECGFGYRDSRFKHEPHIILVTSLMLRAGEPAVARKKIEEIMETRKNTQPQGTFSAGCLFKNFEFHDESELERIRRDDDEIPSKFFAQHRIPAGWLIEKLGLKGYTIGKAQVSLVHGNFLVNLGGARAQDVVALSSYVKMKVRNEYGILLEDEVQYVGF